jgi:O-antigen biosynthesis protein WbqP
MKRAFDVTLAAGLLVAFAVPMLVIAAAVRLSSRGPALYWSDRVGRENRLFRMPKFRSMRTDTPAVATHLLADSARWITPVGRLLRQTSLDELPQLWSIVRGDMSFVGPRPALFNQDDLITLRTARGVHRLTPGLTGWAQVNGRDELSIPEKVALDAEYAAGRSFAWDLQILWMTCGKVLGGEGVRQTGDRPHDTNSSSQDERRAA